MVLALSAGSLLIMVSAARHFDPARILQRRLQSSRAIRVERYNIGWSWDTQDALIVGSALPCSSGTKCDSWPKLRCPEGAVCHEHATWSARGSTCIVDQFQIPESQGCVHILRSGTDCATALSADHRLDVLCTNRATGALMYYTSKI